MCYVGSSARLDNYSNYSFDGMVVQRAKMCAGGGDVARLSPHQDCSLSSFCAAHIRDLPLYLRCESILYQVFRIM